MQHGKQRRGEQRRGRAAPDSRAIAVCMAPRITVSSMQRDGDAGAQADEQQVERTETEAAACIGMRKCAASRKPAPTPAVTMPSAPHRQRHRQEPAPWQPVAQVALGRHAETPAQPVEPGGRGQHGEAAATR